MAITTMRKIKQTVMSAPGKLLVGKYLSPRGEFLLLSAKTKKEKELIWAKYGKNRYRNNPDARPVKVIEHYVLG